MKIRKKSWVLSIFATTMLLTACQQTPSTTIIDNDEEDIFIETTMEDVDIDNLSVISLNEEAIDEVWECGDVTVSIKGIKTTPDSISGLYLYEAEANDHKEYEEKMCFLFGEHANLAQKGESGNIHVSCPDCSYHGDIINTMNYVGDNGSKADYIYYEGELRPVPEEMRKVNMTYEEAITETEEIINEIGLEGYEVENIRYWEEHQQITPEGTLASYLGDQLLVYCRQKLQGVYVMSSVLTNSSEPKVLIRFDSKGIFSVQVVEYFFEPYAKLEECISYEIAVEKFKEYMARNKNYNGATFDKLVFEYVITKEYVNGKFINIAVPSWHFYVQRDYTYAPWGQVEWKDVVVSGLDGSITEEEMCWWW